MLLQSSESVKELYTLLKEKLEASKKSPPEPEEAPSLDLGLHPVTVPPTPSTPTTPVWQRLDAPATRQQKQKTDLNMCKMELCWLYD